MPLVHLTAQLTLRRTDLFTSNALSRHPAAWLSDATKEILSPPEFLCQTERSLSNTNISNSSKLAAILSTFRCISSILESLPAANIERFDNEIYGDPDEEPNTFYHVTAMFSLPTGQYWALARFTSAGKINMAIPVIATSMTMTNTQLP